MTSRLAILLLAAHMGLAAGAEFRGKYYSGTGDAGYLELLDISRRMFEPDPEFQNITMLYEPIWNGFVEGPTWGAWWIQNSYGTTYAALPFYREPYLTFLRNAHDLWFGKMGDGKRRGRGDQIAPDGSLCDAANHEWIVYKQGDGRVAIHDWGFEFAAAGLLMQSEALLIGRDAGEIARYLPKLERVASFIESRRDPKNDLFRVGPAANLLAPSYAGQRLADGSHGPAFLAGLSVTYIAALDRLIEVARLAGAEDKAKLHAGRRDSARKGLSALATPEGYFIRSLDPDGTRHGVFGAEKHGYFEASPNHDAIAFRVVDDAQARRIYDRIASIPGLRPHGLIIANYPSYDDLYTEPKGLWRFGHWVNGGHWSTCEARMILAYYRLGAYEDARRSMRKMLEFARQFRMDNPLTEFGGAVYQPKLPVNITYDAFGPAAAMVRGLFEYRYTSDSLTLAPHIPPSIGELRQRFPIRFGTKRIYLAASGSGEVTSVTVNEKPWRRFDRSTVTLPYRDLSGVANVSLGLGGAKPQTGKVEEASNDVPELTPGLPEDLDWKAGKARKFLDALVRQGLGSGYEAAHARVFLQSVRSYQDRMRLQAEGKLERLPKASQKAADRLYVDSAQKLFTGLDMAVAPRGVSAKAQDWWRAAMDGR
ncbi:MAG: hypothetical protein ACKV22_28375 [Bryobacteraceae bacterium]